MDEKHRYTRDIISKIKNLTIKEKYHILSIFKKYNIEFTKNSNGYFFNLDKIDINVLDKVSKCINLIEEKRELIMTLDKKREYYLEYYKNLIDNKLTDTINKKQCEYIQKLILIPSCVSIKKIKSVYIAKQSKNVDPDILIKEYIKSKKITKDSPFYKINSLIIKNSNNNKITKEKTNNDYSDEFRPEDDDYTVHTDEVNVDVIDDIDDVVDVDVDVDDADVDFERSDDYFNEEYYDDDFERSDEFDGTEDNEISNYDYESCETKSKKKNNKRKNIEISSNEIDYYKNLLKQSGFKFDEYKSIKIKMEDYIQ